MNYKNITLNTPSLLIDKSVLLKNIKTMSDYTIKNKINLRPHAKSHKISEISKISKISKVSKFENWKNENWKIETEKWKLKNENWKKRENKDKQKRQSFQNTAFLKACCLGFCTGCNI